MALSHRSPAALLAPLALVLACTGEPADTGLADTADTGAADTGGGLEPIDEDLALALEEGLQAGLDDVKGMGMVMALQLPDRELFTVAVGVSDRDTEQPMVTDDRFGIASVTKTFTATAVLQLVDDGLIDLDDPLSDTVDLLEADTGITIRHLLQHTAGVPEYSAKPDFAAAADQPWTPEQLVALVAEDELLHEPGTAWSYSNTHYVLLGMVITEVTGAPWSEHVEDRILAELDLDATEIPTDDWGEVVTGYYGRQDFPQPLHPTAIDAAGVITSDATDLVRFGEAFGTGELLSAETWAAQTADPEVLVPGAMWFGLSTLMRGDSLDDPELELGHNGALLGYASWMGHRPERGATMVILGNTWARPGGSLNYTYPQDVAAELWELVEAAD